MIVGAVLAGGQARRMGGGDKPLLLAGGRSLLAHALERLAPQVAAAAISANGNPDRFAAFGLPVLPDEFPDMGPLAGVLAGLDWAAARGAEALLSVPGDTVGIPSDLVLRLAPAPAYAETDGRSHWLVGLWPVTSRSSLRDLLSTAPRGPRVSDYARLLAARGVPFEGDVFANVNTPEDLTRLRARLEGHAHLF